MARKRVRGLDEALNELFADYEKALSEAMTYAAQKAQDDIGFKARSCLYEYYENFQPAGTAKFSPGEPNRYERTDSLVGSFIPYMNMNRTGGHIVAEVGMGYDSSKLEGIYYGSAKYQPVDGWWVLDNYLKGIHPTTDGEYLPGAAIYIPVYDPESPEDKMEDYLEKYVEVFNNNLLISFAKQIKGR